MIYEKDNIVPGMAFLKGTGPEGKTCADCEEFLGILRRSGVGKGDLQDGRCQKYISLCRGGSGSRNAPQFRIPPETPSCKYFRTAIYDKRKPKPKPQPQPQPTEAGEPGD